MPKFVRGRLHPLVAAVAVAIILVCLSGLAMMTGVVPSSSNGLAAAHAATPAATLPKSLDLGLPSPKTKDSRSLAVADSLAPGEMLITVAPKRVVTKPIKTAAASVLLRKPTRTPAYVAPTRKSVPIPRIIPIYRDSNNTSNNMSNNMSHNDDWHD